ncbi:response regulator transcription factor [Clostridium sp. 'White wine YQ']|uniref:response regulator transcription factor n=1 Tax=Clostridium sp. 'White wine YQ' TaxID=3027474 RepID=UPI0023660831|nr:response regulator transcription factor [Clostridium sp. 'White wine YQ']MDD7792812.1 response regulator transcription factor [Clostridium sp. 'White wine YQ']
MRKEKVLIVDDEKEIRDLVDIYLKGEGFETIKAGDGEEALKILSDEEVDLVILDIMMPKVDGIEACLKIREEKNIPIIMLSAKTQDIDKILGLNTGADDYVTKPFNPLELIARVKSQLRRFKRLNQAIINEETGFKVKENSNVIQADELVINLESHQIFLNDEEVKLTPIEFDILALLAKNKGKVFSIENIYESVWNEQFIQSDNTVMVHIRKIREKLEENPRNPKYIKTVWGVGYKIDK